MKKPSALIKLSFDECFILRNSIWRITESMSKEQPNSSTARYFKSMERIEKKLAKELSRAEKLHHKKGPKKCPK